MPQEGKKTRKNDFFENLLPKNLHILFQISKFA